jgi:hypothetical protein
LTIEWRGKSGVGGHASIGVIGQATSSLCGAPIPVVMRNAVSTQVTSIGQEVMALSCVTKRAKLTSIYQVDGIWLRAELESGAVDSTLELLVEGEGGTTKRWLTAR